MKDLLQFIQEGGSVVRYHTRPGIKPDTDAHHSHGVAMLCSILAGDDEFTGRTQASANLLMAALTHDLAEQYAGDVSAPAKRKLGLGPALNDLEQSVLAKYELSYEDLLTEEEGVILKLADCFDGMLYCCRELALGNKNVLLIWRRYNEYVLKIAASGTELDIELGLRASNMLEAIKEIYHEITSPTGPEFNVFAERE